MHVPHFIAISPVQNMFEEIVLSRHGWHSLKQILMFINVLLQKNMANIRKGMSNCFSYFQKSMWQHLASNLQIMVFKEPTMCLLWQHAPLFQIFMFILRVGLVPFLRFHDVVAHCREMGLLSGTYWNIKSRDLKRVSAICSVERETWIAFLSKVEMQIPK